MIMRRVLVRGAIAAVSPFRGVTAQAAQAGVSALSPQVVQADPRVVRADSLYLSHDYRSAAAQYDVAAHGLVLDPRSRYRYGVSLSKLGDFAKAVEQFDEAAKAGNPVVLFAAGSAHGRLGQPDAAFKYLNQSMTAGFSNEKLFVDDPGFLHLSSDPRYAAAIRQMRDAFTPCVNRPESHLFDFWVGEWTVVGAGGQQAGTSSVQKILSECVVFENWTDAQGGSGKSLNSYNPQLKKWQQFWVDQYGTVTEYRDSQWVGKSLQYLASGANAAGVTTVQRMTFTPVDSQTVRQFGESSTDGGKTWTTSYDLYYHRKK